MYMTEKNDLSELEIAIVDDHDLVLEGFRGLLNRNGQHNMELFHNAASLIGILPTHTFDIYIIDVELPDMDGFGLIDAIRRAHPSARIIISTIHDELWTVRKLVARQVDAIVYKSADPAYIIEAIRSVLHGCRYYCEEVKAVIDTLHNETAQPSQRELEVLKAIAGGLTSKEIARSLYISENTVEAHRKSLFLKFEARNIADLVMKAVRRGYIN